MFLRMDSGIIAMLAIGAGGAVSPDGSDAGFVFLRRLLKAPRTLGIAVAVLISKMSSRSNRSWGGRGNVGLLGLGKLEAFGFEAS